MAFLISLWPKNRPMSKKSFKYMMQKDKHFIILDSINNNVSYFYELYDWYKHQASLIDHLDIEMLLNLPYIFSLHYRHDNLAELSSWITGTVLNFMQFMHLNFIFLIKTSLMLTFYYLLFFLMKLPSFLTAFYTTGGVLILQN